MPYIGATDENLALHAIVSFGSDTPEDVIRSLVSELMSGEQRRAAGASEALRLIGSEMVLQVLLEASASGNDWVLATLGRLPPALVRPAVEGTALASRLAPMLLLSAGANWLASEDRVMDIGFLVKQNL